MTLSAEQLARFEEWWAEQLPKLRAVSPYKDAPDSQFDTYKTWAKLGYTACLRDSEGVVAANSRSFAEVIIRIGERYETKHFTKLEIVSLRFPGQRLKDEAERMIDAALRLAENKPITGGE